MKSMKKQYVKPELYFENFELSTSIAACEHNTGTHAKNVCGITIPGVEGTAFSADIEGCTREGTDGPDSICYHNTLGGLFAS